MSSEPTRVAQDELIERVNQLLEEDEWYEAAEGAYEHACAAFARAEAVCADRPALYWYLARLYAHHGFFDGSAEALSHLISPGSEESDPDVQRLWAEVSWWREHSKWLPWIR